MSGSLPLHSAGPSGQLGPLGSMPAVHKVPTALLWLRRDLRVADNPALVAALQGAVQVIPVFVWAPEEEGQFQPGRSSRWWLRHSLEALEADMKALGSSIIYRNAPESRTALVQLVQETGAQALFFNHLYDPISLVRDNEVKAAMVELGVACYTFNSDVLYEPWEVLSPAGQPLVNFADFWKQVCSMSYPPPLPLPVPASMPPVQPPAVGLDLSGLGILSSKEDSSAQHLDFNWQPGGRGAHLVLEEFVLQRLKDFSGNRAKTDVRSTSRVSPHAHYGEISTRHIYYAVKQQEAAMLASGVDAEQAHASCEDFLRQMGYREYSRYLSFHFPFTHERSLLEHLRACPWRWDQGHFKAWRQGRTGYPLVDAGMRELWSTGWMHNRMRVVCASFLVKNLLLPWQWGLKHYWDAQLDADLECAALGWQYCSGCLADAHSFGFMLDHKTEALRFDPSGNYVRRWLPVLSRVPTKWIHRPHKAPAEVLQDAGVELGANYEWPIISGAEARGHLAHACSVIERCLARAGPTNSESGQSEPYRLPSAPMADTAQQPHSGVSGTGKRRKRNPGRIASGRQPEEPEVPPAPHFEGSDEEVLSNAPAEQQPRRGPAAAPAPAASAASGAPNGASPERRPRVEEVTPATGVAPLELDHPVAQAAQALVPDPADEPYTGATAAGADLGKGRGGEPSGAGSCALPDAGEARPAATPAGSHTDAVVPDGDDAELGQVAARTVKEADEIATAAARARLAAGAAAPAPPGDAAPAPGAAPTAASPAKRKRHDQ